MDEQKKELRFRYLILALIPLAVLAVYVLRLYDWQILNGDQWLSTADHSTQTVVDMAAARGEILDSEGNPLAVNKTGYSIVFNWLYMKQSTTEETNRTENATIHQLILLLEEKGVEWLDTLPIHLTEDGAYAFDEGADQEIETLKGKDYADVNSYADADTCMANLAEKYGVEGYSKEETRDIVSVRYNMTKERFSTSYPYTFAEDISLECVSIISENSQKLPGVTVEVTTTREYHDTSLIPQIVGQLGKIPSMDLYNSELKDKGYQLDDLIGTSGIEEVFEDQLRGTPGQKLVETTSTGQLAGETVIQAPEAGQTVYLTIDSNLQKVTTASLGKNVEATRQNGESLSASKNESKFGEDCYQGAAVVLDVTNGSVLAAGSFPTYDSALAKSDASYYQELLEDDLGKPLVNKAFSGIYAPGSCFKPLVACAALEEGVITNTTQVTCTGKYTRFENDNAHTCMGVHGSIPLRSALMVSCNVYFYEVGYQLGIDPLNLYCERFGLGVATGVEVWENPGRIAGPAVKSPWYEGDTVNAAIGQSENAFTPLQLATMTATIANNGTRLKTTVVKQITDYTRTQILQSVEPEIAAETGVSQEYIDYVKDGMEAVITEQRGTGHSVFGDYPVQIAGKTGTAQNSGSDHVWFIGYAPADNPQIAFAVVLEHGSTPRYCQNVVKDILDAYFYDTTVDENGTIYSPSQQEAAQKAAEAGSQSSASQGE